MATRFYEDSIVFEHSWTVLYPNADGYKEKFLEQCKEFAKRADFPNVVVVIEEYKTGGLFFNQEVTPMVSISFTKSQFTNLGVFFRAQKFGNLMYYSLFETVDKGFWDTVSGRSKREIETRIRNKCKNLAQYEEYSSLISFGELIFRSVMKSLDNDWEINKIFFSMNQD